MKQITQDLTKHTTIKIVPLADLHLGDPNSDKKIVEQWIDRILNDPDMFCVLGGDLMNDTTRTSIGDIFAEKLSPMEQLRECVRLFQPLVSANKVLAIVPGNHEARQKDGLDMTAIMAEQLDIGDLYSPTSCLLFLKMPVIDGRGYNQPYVAYSMYFQHGNGGGKRPGGKINALEDYSKICDADIYCVCHTHLPAVFKTNYFRTNGHCSALLAQKVFVNTASALIYGGYGDRKGFVPAQNAYPVISIYAPTAKDIWRGRQEGHEAKRIEVVL